MERNTNHYYPSSSPTNVDAYNSHIHVANDEKKMGEAGFLNAST